MNTNFKKESKLLLIDENNKGVAVLACPSGWHNLKAQLIQAISEDLGCYKVLILDNQTIEQNSTQEFNFSATLWDNSSGEQHNELANFSLLRITEY